MMMKNAENFIQPNLCDDLILMEAEDLNNE